MRAIIELVLSLSVLACTSAAQDAQPSAQNLLATAKQAYTQDGPKAALPQFEEALKMFRAGKDHHGEAVTLGYVANCYRKLEDLDKALEFAQQALHMKEELNDRDEIGKTHNQLGLIYWERADYPAAVQHLQQAIDVGSSVGDKELEGSARNNLGLVFDERRDRLSSTSRRSHFIGSLISKEEKVTPSATSAEFICYWENSGRRFLITGRHWPSARGWGSSPRPATIWETLHFVWQAAATLMVPSRALIAPWK